MTTNLTPVEMPEWVKLVPLDSKNNQPVYTSMHEYKEKLDTAPPPQWIRSNPYSQNAKYIPIGIIEEILSRLYPLWQVEQHGEPKILGNAVVISVNLKVYHPIIGEWLTYCGVGAVPIELQKNTPSPIDFSKINAKALHKNVPAAMSFAVNNAAKKIGKIFGSHLNRKESIYGK